MLCVSALLPSGLFSSQTVAFLSSQLHVPGLTGWQGTNHNYAFNLRHAGGKGNTWEGGIRVPAVLKLPGVIPAGSVVSRPTHITDILPTVAGLTGLQLPNGRIYDGTNLLPILTGLNRSDQTAVEAATTAGAGTTTGEFMFHYCGDTINAVRYTPNGGKESPL